MTMQAAETVQNSAPIVERSTKVRSKLSNGKRLLPMTDGRSATARRFRDLYEDICIDLGGVSLLSTGQMQLAKRAAMLNSECERLEALSCRDERMTHADWHQDQNNKFDIDTYGMLCDRLGRLFDRLGLERRARPIEESDVVRHFSPGRRPAL